MAQLAVPILTKSPKVGWRKFCSGGPDGSRTHDLLHAMQAL